ncbi:hypothetical protein [Burkholderia cepacia]|uniref:hypothetical protein n=1 Tax=Burkholderia cepacia TaxID=292 RepID=UPI000A73779D
MNQPIWESPWQQPHVCPTDFDLLLNPLHADFASSVKVIGKEAFVPDPRLFG